jgi:alpha-beta hydrolase superfamily lysophospholipase
MKTSIIDINETSIHLIDWGIEKPSAVLLIVHGYAEHSLRYDHVAKYFNSHSFHARSFDFYGHGKSGGVRAFVEDFETYVAELEAVTELTKTQFPNIPIFILAHSMGGTVTGIAAAKKRLNGLDKIIFSNPGLDITSNQPAILVKLIRLLAPIVPKLKTTKLSSEFISRDPIEREKYDNDPLNYREGTRPGFAHQFDKASSWLRENASKIDQDFYLNYALSDKVVYPEASVAFFEAISSADKTKTHYEGLYHELLNEPEKEEVLENILVWCKNRM